MSGPTDSTHREQPKENSRLQALSETEVRYRGIMDTVPDLVFILDGSGVVVEANRAACRWLDYSVGELVGKRFKSFLDGNVSEVSQAESTGRFGKVSGIRAALRTRKNSVLPVEIWTTARLNGLGEFCGSLTIARTIESEEMLAERLRVTEQMFDAVSEGMELGVSIHNAAYVVTFQNDFLEKTYPNALGEKCYRVYRGLDKPCGNCLVRHAMEQGRIFRECVDGTSAEGRKVYFEMVGVPIMDDEGRVTGGFEIVRDITTLKAKIDKLNRSGGGERGPDICKIFGEVNQPLSGISGYSELLRKSVGTGEPAYRYATKIYEQSQRLADLIRKINKTPTIQESKEGKST